MRIIWLGNVAHMVTSEADSTIPLVRTVNGKTVLSETGYRALHARPATAAEVQAWRWGKSDQKEPA